MDIFLIVIKFAVLGISLAAPIGPINLEMIKRGVTGGFYSSWLVGLGGMTADIMFLLCILIGMEPFLQLEIIQISMYGIGSSLLLYLGFSSIMTNIKNNQILTIDQPIQKNSFLVGFGIAAFNPINFVFWFGIFGSSIQSLIVHGWHIAFVGSIALLCGIFLWNLNIAFTVHFARTYIKDQILRVINLVAGLLLIIAAVPFLKSFFELVF
ncbi:LysE family translocator [Sutcliffiella rhizosphaerae]|uniref:Amino acid transporter n=1 Tax=Sutcliffiella rhizosphaerae TaxID=2880967 RepID=A0ABM8YNN1_9BACI|nr:LysE family transporter [Sutcliffiella rhizosphaerae]CAG9621590.1 hypothetical protein BACCIP111883_02363 [Sutcliffiella rhizosphaerae]